MRVSPSTVQVTLWDNGALFVGLKVYTRGEQQLLMSIYAACMLTVDLAVADRCRRGPLLVTR